MEIKWIAIEDQKPPGDTPVLISAGEIVTAAQFDYDTQSSRYEYFLTGVGFGGYDWDWDFHESAVTHWAVMPHSAIPKTIDVTPDPKSLSGGNSQSRKQ